MKKTGIILQARMGSTRLPAKVMRKINNFPLLWYCIQQLQAIGEYINITIAIPDKDKGTKLDEYIRNQNWNVFYGSELDVLDRYYKCALENSFDPIIRATSDNPFTEPLHARELINSFLNNNLEYMDSFQSNNIGLPKGLGLEVFSFSALEKSWKDGDLPHHREHVNEYILENPELFPQGNYLPKIPQNLIHKSFTVDTIEEFHFIENIIQKNNNNSLFYLETLSRSI